MAEKKSRGALGRGLFDIFDDNENASAAKNVAAEKINITSVTPRKDQPRKMFDKEALQVLADSISQYGVLQPIIVREDSLAANTYEIIAGERRWRAAKLAGLSEIPAVIVDSDELKTAQISIIENVQREDLNPVEEAMAYAALIDKFGLKQDEVAQQVGKNRSTIANMLRLLDLPEEALELLRQGMISTGHARTLLALENTDAIVPLAQKIVENNMSVREVENAVKKLNDLAQADEEAEIAAPSQHKMMARSYMRDLERRSMEALGRKVRILQTSRKRVVELSFDSNDDLEVLLTAICGQEIFSEN
jgi:ParB family chromosome partitioning protein